MSNRDKVISLFKKGRGSYGISIELRISVKEVYHYIEEYENKHRKSKVYDVRTV